MILGVGNDILEVGRIQRELDQSGPSFRERLFSPDEIAYCDAKRYPAQHYAARFAAKEAFLKALNTGLRDGLSWKDMEVRNGAAGAPELILSGAALALARQRGIERTFLSLSHTSSLAMASVVLEGEATSPSAAPRSD
jgi:holo-[acyl-carrier protein] synthase